MIAKRIIRDRGGRSDFSRLAKYMLTAEGRSDPATWVRTAEYVLDTAHEGAKVGTVRITNCQSEDPAMAVAEITATQARNTRSKTDKTYHLVVSFPPGERPDEAQMKYIEDELCAAIGFADHQRLSAVHTDTDHLHLHVAINKVNPRNFSNIEPYFDYRRLMETCTRLEIELNLERTHQRSRDAPTLEPPQESLDANAHLHDREFDPRESAALRKSYLEAIAAEPQALTLNGVRTLSGVGVVHLDSGGEVLLPGHAPHDLEPPGAERDDSVRRGGHGAGSAGARRRESVAAIPEGANRMEAFASRESLVSFIQENVREKALGATSWGELHGILAPFGLEIRRRGAGLVIGTTAGLFVKASDVDRSLAWQATTERLGPFQNSTVDSTNPHGQYQAEPKQQRPSTGALFAAYQRERAAALAARRAARERLREAHRRYAGELAAWYERERSRRKADPRLRGRVKFEALRDLGRRKRTDFAARRELEKTQWAEARAASPLPTWQAFLAARAAGGDLEALAVLRSRASASRRRPDTLRPENPEGAQPTVVPNLGPRARQNGDLVYRLGDGGVVIDSAKAVRVETASEAAVALAVSLAATRFAGQRIHIDGPPEFGIRVARTARAQANPMEFADAALEAERRGGGGAPTPAASERPDAVEEFLAERNNLRSRVSHLDFHRRWSSADAGTYRYGGRRHLEDGSHVLLLEGTEKMLVMPVTAAEAAKASAWALQTPIEVDERGRLTLKPTRTRPR